MAFEQGPEVEDEANQEDFRRKSIPSTENSNSKGYVGKGGFQGARKLMRLKQNEQKGGQKDMKSGMGVCVLQDI